MGQLCVCVKENETDESKNDKKIENAVKNKNTVHYESNRGGIENLAFENDTKPMAILDTEEETKEKSIGVSSFSILKVIGTGSMGKVFLVEKKDTRKVYAMKIMRKTLIQERNQKELAKTENYILRNNKSPFLVQLYCAFQSKEKLYLVMEYIPGGDLYFHLRQSLLFEESRAKFYASGIVLALEYLHKKNIIYRDLKPENVLICSDGYIKIVDFGLSKMDVKEEVKCYTFCGTPEYLAPEILVSMGHDRAADWWSLGAVLYEMLAGTPPFFSSNRYDMFKNILEPKKRLGSSPGDAEDIKDHPFFAGIDWVKLQRKAVTAPYIPALENSKDIRNFDEVITNLDVNESYFEVKEPPENTEPVQDYSNFSYAKMDFFKANTIVLIQFSEEIRTRSFLSFSSLGEALEALCSLFEEEYRVTNPEAVDCKYSFENLCEYIHAIKELVYLTLNSETKSYTAHGREWVKENLYNYLKQKITIFPAN